MHQHQIGKEATQGEHTTGIHGVGLVRGGAEGKKMPGKVAIVSGACGGYWQLFHDCDHMHHIRTHHINFAVLL